jgi:hypothetical protein
VTVEEPRAALAEEGSRKLLNHHGNFQQQRPPRQPPTCCAIAPAAFLAGPRGILWTPIFALDRQRPEGRSGGVGARPVAKSVRGPTAPSGFRVHDEPR